MKIDGKTEYHPRRLNRYTTALLNEIGYKGHGDGEDSNENTVRERSCVRVCDCLFGENHVEDVTFSQPVSYTTTTIIIERRHVRWCGGAQTLQLAVHRRCTGPFAYRKVPVVLGLGGGLDVDLNPSPTAGRCKNRLKACGLIRHLQSHIAPLMPF
ncbi:metallo-beta-lactamase superfamily hydrolase [Anopheles sinensis]|uniref:Metallo-beta-lactamase superfamily hydrolase n=1 Tax=Anopheles sinensis TaxID=74873 RepID=A0A084VT37_ANOSI|nr:metallo-beta-lactamase superfamily hydrolase [Anopheles sinensis]